MNKCGIRLPGTVRPVHYEITLIPDLVRNTFKGFARIELKVLKPTKKIVFHTKELQVKGSLDASSLRGAPQHAKRTVYDPDNDRVKLVFENTIEPGTAYLSLEFTGIINDQMAGFYRSNYKVDGEERTMAVTQFEEISARRAFPCWDEPALKATFRFRFIVPRNLEVVSNMPIEHEATVGGNTKSVDFETSPIMSTYLAAFAIGEFERLESVTKEGTKVSVLMTPGKKEEGQFALEVGVKVLEFYNDYFGIPYPLPKLDMLAVPDFAAGAMENWGLVTYRETALLVNEEHSSTARKQRVAIVVAHELAHQWFGNLVTMDWWTQLWLNEGFATWMEYRAVDHVFPEWKIWDQFVSSDMGSAFSADGLRTTHAIEIEIKHPNEIGQNFDSISYEKSAAIIRMIHEYIGAKAFRQGLSLYLKRHAYGNATTEDLWQALEEVSGKPVRKIMDTWTKQKGYPLISVAPHKDKRNTLVFSQKRFLSSGEELLPEEAEQSWHVALPCATGSGRRENILLSGLNAETTLEFACDERWIKCNHGQSTFARVKYPALFLRRMEIPVRRGELQSGDRVGLISDLFATVRSGESSIMQLLNFLKSFEKEREYVVWSEILFSLKKVRSLIADESETTRLHFSSIIRGYLLDRAVQLVGWDEREDETHSQRLLRPLILGAAVDYDHTQVMYEARRRFANFLSDKSSLDPNLRLLACNAVAKTGSKADFNTLLRCYREANRQEEKVQYLSALARFEKNEFAAEEARQFAFSDEVRPQDYYIFTSALSSGEMARKQWEFVKERWEKFFHRYETSMMLLGSNLEYLICGLETNEDLADVENFLQMHPVPRATQSVSQAIERVRSWIAWKERDKEKLLYWINSHS